MRWKRASSRHVTSFDEDDTVVFPHCEKMGMICGSMVPV
jgi:hypothetical protein